MQQTILFKVPGKPSTSPVVILSALDLAGKSKTNHFRVATKMLSRALSKAAVWVKCNCTPMRIVRALFSARVSKAVAVVCIAAMWWHNITIDDPAAAEVAVATDCICALPWAIVWVCRETFSEKGGKK